MIFDSVILKDVKPELSGYLSGSLGLLSGEDLPGDKAVHDIRVYMKKARAAIKLISPLLEDETFRKEYESYREVGRQLSTWRDTAVQRKTLKNFRKVNPGLFKSLSGDGKIMALMAKPVNVTDNTGEREKRRAEIHGILHKAVYRLRFLTLSETDPEVLLGELEKTYLRAGKIYLKCRNNTRPDCIHELRKVCKDFLYQLSFFRPLNPPAVKKLEKTLDSLTQDLGKYNDLYQVVMSLGYKYKANKNPAVHELVIMIRDRQDQYLSRVWPPAYKVFCPGKSLLNVLGYKVVVL